MSDWLFLLVSQWGVVALTLVTFLSCLAIPVPSSLMMMAAGAFAAAGDVNLVPATTGALIGAILGDQLGYQIGRVGLAAAEKRLNRRAASARGLERARASVHRHGVIAVFLSRWLFSPLGPYVNLLAGGARMNWPKFTAAQVAGETVWVAVYMGLGYVAGGQFEQIWELLGNVTALASSLIVTLGLGYLMVKRRHHPVRSR